MKHVFVNIESDSLGDNISWLPYIEEYRKLRKCEVFTNFRYPNLFWDSYPNLKFSNSPYGGDIINISILNKEIPLQKAATDALGLPFKEIRPEFNFKKLHNIGNKIVTISEFGSDYSRMWNNPYGWNTVVQHLKSKSYKVMSVSLESTLLNSVEDYTDRTLIEVCNAIYSSDVFIGVSSGLAWLAWTLKVPVIMIGANTFPYFEFKEGNHRISAVDTNKDICVGCYNNNSRSIPLEDGWCPNHRNTVRQHECTKTISPLVVIKEINKLLKI